MRVCNVSRGLLLGDSVRRADTFVQRLLGLMFRPPLLPGEGLWIEPCSSVHTHFMRFPIDVAFVDREGYVLRVMPHLRPWRLSPIVARAAAALELPAGALGETAVGDRITLCPD